MFGLKKFLLLTGLVMLILTGCGSKVDETDSANGSGTDTEQNEESTENNSEDNTEETSDQENNQDEVIRILEDNIEYSVNGELKEETAFLKYGDNQGYSMYVLPDYELTAEEPHKDVLMYKENDQIFMRIELLPQEVEWNSIEETTKAQLNAVSSEIKTVESPDSDFFKESTVLEAAGSGDVVTSYLVKSSENPIKLTVFSKENEDHQDAFLKMAETILKENNQ
ncbi:hypothetical protein ACFYKX_23620 [Cytobacillus sp. FJAT-54145]|uniref:Lipoprotein n=1 Tax=Cytobacillus spartinae TaxID=3299023 RepID=A0ABW6KH37_9BACI